MGVYYLILVSMCGIDNGCMVWRWSGGKEDDGPWLARTHG